MKKLITLGLILLLTTVAYGMEIKEGQIIYKKTSDASIVIKYTLLKEYIYIYIYIYVYIYIYIYIYI